MMDQNEIDTFLKRSELVISQGPARMVEYLLLCKDGAGLAKKYPEKRTIIAESLVSVGSTVRLNLMFDLAPELEYPSKAEDWKRMEDLANGAINELTEEPRAM